MRSEDEIRSTLDAFLADDLLKQPPASVTGNPSLALAQVELDVKILTLRWVLDGQCEKEKASDE